MASRSVNKVILIGHLGRDAETAYTASQVPVTKFSVATSRRWKDQATGDWKEEKKVWATDVVADEVILLGGRGDSGGPSGGGDEYSQQEPMRSAPRGRGP